MAGQQQLKKYNQRSLQEKHNNSFLKGVEQYYQKNFFALNVEYNELKTIHSFILKDVLCDDNCEIVNFLNKKLRGALGCENIDIVDLKTMQTKYRDINNYYYSSANYEEVQF